MNERMNYHPCFHKPTNTADCSSIIADQGQPFLQEPREWGVLVTQNVGREFSQEQMRKRGWGRSCLEGPTIRQMLARVAAHCCLAGKLSWQLHLLTHTVRSALHSSSSSITSPNTWHRYIPQFMAAPRADKSCSYLYFYSSYTDVLIFITIIIILLVLLLLFVFS